jgi:hypothetical protein
VTAGYQFLSNLQILQSLRLEGRHHEERDNLPDENHRRDALKHFWMRSAIYTVLALGSIVPAFSSGITYTCDSVPTDPGYVSPSVCAYLNNTIAAIYNTTFTNATADIYIQYGAIDGLAESTKAFNLVSYSTYLSDLTATASGDTIDVDALAALNSLDTGIYGSGNVNITAALGTALGISGMIGVNIFGTTCFQLGPGCYDGVITVTTQANLTSQEPGQTLWYRTGTQPADSYDFYSAVEHETDEILGTASCIDTQTTPLSDPCGPGVPSAVDLFRFSSAGSLVTTSALSTTPGAYFSYNGGLTNGADGAIYNTLDNGEDYADFMQTCQFVQDAAGCLGENFDINTDGPDGTPGPEVNILDAVGFNVAAPEPGTFGTLGFGLTALGALAYRRRESIAGVASVTPLPVTALEEAKLG